MTTQSLGVFCGSSWGAAPVYGEVARRLGCSLAQRGVTVVYGGGNVGLMGAVADAAMQAGGQVIGVIPQSLADKEVAHHGVTQLYIVDTMHQRKARMAELSDAFVALPGGFGTLDEFCEIVTWRQLGLHAKPCGMLNVAGYFDSLLRQFELGVSAGFVKPEHRRIIFTSDDCDQLLDRLGCSP